MLGHSINGSKIFESDVKKMALFLSSDRYSEQGSSHMINVLNDGVLQKDFLETKILPLIVREYDTLLLPKFTSRWEKIKHFQPYQHPQANFINAASLWEKFAPKINEDLALLKKSDNFTSKEFSILADLYLQQTKFPASALRRLTIFQQQQHSDILFDQRLYEDDLVLFGFHNLAEWFSEDLLEIVSEFIINAAQIAEKEGLKLSYDEVKKNLWDSFYYYMHQAFGNEKLTDETLATIYYKQLRFLGMDERSVVEIFRKILLFRKLFDKQVAAISFDPLAIEEFSGFVGDKFVVHSYGLPKHLQLKSWKDLFLFQIYLKTVSPEPANILDLPKEPLPIAKIKEAAPSLIDKRYVVDFAQVNKSEIGLRVKVKELRAWQMQDENFALLKREFPALSAKETKKDRFSLINSLEEELKAKINSFSLEKIILSHPEWIKEALQKKPLQQKEFNRSSLQNELFLGIQNTNAFVNLLDQAPFGTDVLSELENESAEKLEFYTEDGKIYSYFKLRERGEEEILSFSEAHSNTIIEPLYDKFLESQYFKVRLKAPKKFKDETGEWKPIEEVKEEVALLIFSDLIKAIKQEASLEKNDNPFEWRFFTYFRETKNELEQNPENSNVIFNEKNRNLFAQQWNLIREERVFSRKDHETQIYHLASLKEGDWSDIKEINQGLHFIKMIRKEEDPSLLFQNQKKDVLLQETKRIAVEKLLLELKEKHILPSDKRYWNL